MNEFGIKLNNLLVDTFRTILKVEQDIIKKNDRIPLTISEVHLIEAAYNKDNSGKTVSDISQALNITLPSVTICVNKLVRKGLLQKEKNSEDGRSVYIKLTKAGQRINRAHHYFHKQMIDEVSAGLTESEKSTMITAINKLNHFFKEKAYMLENKV